MSNKEKDNLLLYSIDILNQENDAVNAGKLINHIVDIEERVGAYLQSGKLKSAYFEAINGSRDDQVIRVRNTANQVPGNSTAKNIVELCDKYLKKPK